MEPQLKAVPGGWVAVGDGLAISASCGQEALFRFEVERWRRESTDDSRAAAAHGLPAVVRQPVEAPMAPISVRRG